ncbi:MAG: hypothetical protein HS102_18265 [Planctomycetia bacterium]|nr:hypothetical protein [Planctomycetia bacterium]
MSERNVAEPHGLERTEEAAQLRKVGEYARGFLDAEVEHVGDGSPPKADIERLAVEATASAGFAGDVDIRKEVHLNAFFALSGAGLAAPAAGVEAEARRSVSTYLGFTGRGKKTAQFVEASNVGRRVAA